MWNFSVLLDVGHVGARTKGPSGAGDHDGPDPVVRLGAPIGVGQFLTHLPIDCVELLRPIQRDGRHRIGHVVGNGLVGQGVFLIP
jgi:hypothetical protein